jgi:hypothetical protein
VKSKCFFVLKNHFNQTNRPKGDKVMQRTMFCLVVIICFTGLAGSAFAQDGVEADVEMILKHHSEIMEALQNSDVKNLNNSSREVQTTAATTSEHWYSKDPADLEPLKGGEWSFEYTVNDDIFTREITFSTTVVTLNDGSVTMSCSDNLYSKGTVFYTDLIQGGRGFVIAIDNSYSTTEWFCYFEVTVTGGSAEGLFWSLMEGSSTPQFPLTGKCLSGCPDVFIPGDTNQDGKLDMKDVIYILQIITDIR